MARFGFVGPSYVSESVNADCQDVMNWYPESIESGDGNSAAALYPTPGSNTFATIEGSSVRGEYEFNGRLFAVGANFNEINSLGGVTPYNFLPVDNNPVTMAANNANQLIVCAGGQLWLFWLLPVVSLEIVSVGLFSEGGGMTQNPYVTFDALTPFPWANGTAVEFNGLTNATFLNGVTLTAISQGFGGNPNTVLFSTITHSAYADTADTGTATLPNQTSQFIQVAMGQGPFASVDFVDGYFIALQSDSQQFYLSGLEDGTSWDPIDVSEISEYADNIVGMIVDHREIGFFGPKRTVIYQNTGDALNPFQPIEGAFIEQGLASQWAVSRMDNSIFWLGSDERGQGMAWRANGWTPVRVSNHAVERAWQQYSTISDAISYTMQWNGHSWWVIYFPTANVTWVYDAATGSWFRWGFYNPITAKYTAHRSRCHAFAFGFHLVGDWQSGNIYALSEADNTDFGFAIRRYRRAPHVSEEQQWMFHSQLQVYLESGLGPQPPLAGPPMGVSSITLQATDGSLWILQINDDGTLRTTATTVGTPTAPIFQDWATGSTFWQLGVLANGQLTTTQVFAPLQYYAALPFVTIGQKQSRLYVNVLGELQDDMPVSASRAPQVMLRWSNDGGHTWSNEIMAGAGKAGEYSTRVLWRRLGPRKRSGLRNRMY